MESEDNPMEAQMLALQEQLVAAIIENQNLADQVKKLTENGTVEKLFAQLEREKEKIKILLEKLQEKERETKKEVDTEREKMPSEKNLHQGDKSPRSPSRGRFGWRRRGLEKSKSLDQSEFLSSLSPEGDSNASENYDDEEEKTSSLGCLAIDKHIKSKLGEDEGVTSVSNGNPLQNLSENSPPKLFFRRIHVWLWRQFLDLLKDFSVTEEEDQSPMESEGDPLTVRKLKENVIRFSNIMRPFYDLSSSMNSLLKWESPPATFLAFVIYFASILKGYGVSLCLALAIWSLSKNYLKKRGWTMIFFRQAKNREGTEISDSGDAKLSDKFVVVLQVAKRVQNLLGAISDTAEKLKNLLLWEHEATKKLYFMLWFLLFSSLLLWPSQLFVLAGIYLGVKMFVLDFIFFKFPRIRQKYDSTTRLWDTLPTDADLERRNDKFGVSATDLNSFLELFNLPPSESPIQGWQGGKRCTLVNRDKSITSAFRNGRLYLTNRLGKQDKQEPSDKHPPHVCKLTTECSDSCNTVQFDQCNLLIKKKYQFDILNKKSTTFLSPNTKRKNQLPSNHNTLAENDNMVDDPMGALTCILEDGDKNEKSLKSADMRMNAASTNLQEKNFPNEVKIIKNKIHQLSSKSCENSIIKNITMKKDILKRSRSEIFNQTAAQSGQTDQSLHPKHHLFSQYKSHDCLVSIKKKVLFNSKSPEKL